MFILDNFYKYETVCTFSPSEKILATFFVGMDGKFSTQAPFSAERDLLFPVLWFLAKHPKLFGPGMGGSVCPIIVGQVPSGDLGQGWLSQEGTRGRPRSWRAG